MLMAPTCVFLASKVEVCKRLEYIILYVLVHIRFILSKTNGFPHMPSMYVCVDLVIFAMLLNGQVNGVDLKIFKPPQIVASHRNLESFPTLG